MPHITEDPAHHAALEHEGATLAELVERDRELARPSSDAPLAVRMVDLAELPTRFGTFRIVGFWNNRDEGDHVAVIHGEVAGRTQVLTRLHSECVTGDALGSLRCDCRDQLEHALRRIAEAECGIVLYLRQEGRGIGILNKIRAYALQDEGLDTVEANLALGFPDDTRDYSLAAAMLERLGCDSIELMTNNPDKVDQLVSHGVEVAGRVSHLLPTNPHNRFYLHTKARRSGHLIEPGHLAPTATPP